MSENRTEIQRNALRTIIVTLVVYSIVTTVAIIQASDLLMSITLINLLHGGLLIGLMEKHSSRSGIEYLFYPFAILAPVLSGCVFYYRYRNIS